MRSREGVRMVGAPYTPRSFTPTSSAIRIKKFGLLLALLLLELGRRDDGGDAMLACTFAADTALFPSITNVITSTTHPATTASRCQTDEDECDMVSDGFVYSCGKQQNIGNTACLHSCQVWPSPSAIQKVETQHSTLANPSRCNHTRQQLHQQFGRR